MSKYKLPEVFIKCKQHKGSRRYDLRERITKPICDIFADMELPIIEATCVIEQGVTESAKLFQIEPIRSLNGTFTITIKINGGAQHIVEEDPIIKVKRSFLRGTKPAV